MTTNDNLRGLKALLPDLDEALEQLEMHGRHSDQGYRKLKDWYRKIALATKAIDAALAEPDSGEVVRNDTQRLDWLAANCDIDWRGNLPDGNYSTTREMVDAALNKAPAKAETGVKS